MSIKQNKLNKLRKYFFDKLNLKNLHNKFGIMGR